MKVLDQVFGENFALYNGDCCEVIQGIPDQSIHLSVYSPPFCSLYSYSDSERDMSNNTDESFGDHYKFLVHELARVTKPGRLSAVHCQQIPSMQFKDGYIGLKDFRGDIIRVHQEAGWIYHSEVCIWKDPVVQMQRTKALGLLYKQVRKDSCMSRMGLPEYVLMFRRPGENPERVSHEPAAFPLPQWQQWASPVWMDIDPGDTLQYRAARAEEDERHICPLALEVIRRIQMLWSNPGDVILSPFAGIGSEGVVALGGQTRTGLSVDAPRRALMIELKRSYFEQAALNLQAAEKVRVGGQMGLFEEVPA